MSHLRSACARHSHAALSGALLALALLTSPAVFARNELSVQALRFIDEQRIPHKQSFQQTTIGGLSGIGYDTRTDT